VLAVKTVDFIGLKMSQGPQICNRVAVVIVKCFLMFDVEADNQRGVIRTVQRGSVKMKPFGYHGTRMTVFQSYFFYSQSLRAEVETAL